MSNTHQAPNAKVIQANNKGLEQILRRVNDNKQSNTSINRSNPNNIIIDDQSSVQMISC